MPIIKGTTTLLEVVRELAGVQTPVCIFCREPIAPDHSLIECRNEFLSEGIQS